MKKIAVIDNSIQARIYNPVSHWSRFLPWPCRGFKAKKKQFPGLKQGFTHFILTGSEASIMEREDWVEDEIEFVREIVEKGYPVLGSCYGHQVLALALTGPAHVQRSPQPELGWCSIQINTDNEMLGKKGRFHAYTLHFDEVINLDGRFRILASTPSCRVHVFSYENSPVWGIQAHPEIDIETGIKLFQDMAKINSKDAHLYRKALASNPHDSGKIISIADCFCQQMPSRYKAR